ncbi:MAG: prephenate/arogenate dehydrogenase [Gloeomargaritaceae cyanobacterium C42_A2020_066]|nr:prephenate/arogenate dehydrogenase [Gloeomargaritaceae cyanobacterium C42_A2020_066]
MDIGIVGLGLIGGSLGRDWRALGHRVWGVSRQAATVEQAVAMGAIDGGSTDLASFHGRPVAVVVICTPLDQVVPTGRALFPHLETTTVVTDVGSVKAPIVAALEPAWRRFVGGHPMAGTADQGIQAAQRGLFAGRPYVLTPTATTDPDTLACLTTLLRPLGCHLHPCDPAAHDQAVAWISHLPVLVSAALVGASCTGPSPAVLALAQALASSGFQDTSRVGGGNPDLGLLMARENRPAVAAALDHYRRQIDYLATLIQTEDWAALHTYLRQTQAGRPAFVAPDPPPAAPPQPL